MKAIGSGNYGRYSPPSLVKRGCHVTRFPRPYSRAARGKRQVFVSSCSAISSAESLDLPHELPQMIYFHFHFQLILAIAAPLEHLSLVARLAFPGSMGIPMPRFDRFWHAPFLPQRASERLPLFSFLFFLFFWLPWLFIQKVFLCEYFMFSSSSSCHSLPLHLASYDSYASVSLFSCIHRASVSNVSRLSYLYHGFFAPLMHISGFY